MSSNSSPPVTLQEDKAGWWTWRGRLRRCISVSMLGSFGANLALFPNQMFVYSALHKRWNCSITDTITCSVHVIWAGRKWHVFPWSSSSEFFQVTQMEICIIEGKCSNNLALECKLCSNWTIVVHVQQIVVMYGQSLTEISSFFNLYFVQYFKLKIWFQWFKRLSTTWDWKLLQNKVVVQCLSYAKSQFKVIKVLVLFSLI